MCLGDHYSVVCDSHRSGDMMAKFSEDRIVDLKFDDIIHKTDHAYLFLFGDKEVWLPKSWVEVDKRDKVVSIFQSRAEEKEIEGFAI